MIARFTLKKACASIVTVGLVAATLAPGAAHAARPGDLPAVRLATVLADSGVTPATCHVINVQMNGAQPSTATCSLTQDQARSQLQQGVTPDTGTSWGMLRWQRPGALRQRGLRSEWYLVLPEWQWEHQPE